MRPISILSALIAILLVGLLPVGVNATVINVPADVATIQGAIDSAVAGDTVLVSPGTYLEALTIGKEIVVACSTYADRPVISSGGSDCVTFTGSVGNACRFTGFILTGAIYGVELASGRPLIDSCKMVGLSRFHVYNSHPQEVGYYASSNEFVPNTTAQCGGLHIRSGTIYNSTVWPALPSGMVYYVTGGDWTIRVEGANDPELLIEPGVIVKLNSPYYNTHERYFGVGVGGDGTLTANGVYFTSATDDELGGDHNGDGYSTGTPGYWSSIYFGANAGGSRLDGCYIRYGGAQSNNSADAAIYIAGSSPTITGCEFFSNLTNIRAAGGNPTITNNSIMSTGALGYGMWLDIAVVNHNVSGNTFSNGSYYQARLDPMAVEQFVLRDTIGLNPSGKYNAVYIEEGTISDSTVWPALPSGMVYYVTGGDWTVRVQGTGNPELLIRPGVIVKLNSPFYNTHERYFGVGVGGDGTLTANGVYFTSATDDELGGDSNGDGYSTGTPGYWSSIYFGANAGGSRLDGCYIRYGGAQSNNSADAAIYIAGSSPTITGCEFFSNLTNIRAAGGNPTITNNSIMSTGALGYGMWLDIAVVNHNVSGNTFSNGSYYQARLDPMAVEQFVLRDTIGLNPSGKYNAVYIEEGTISDSTVWPALPSGMVYYVTGGDWTVRVQGTGNPELLIRPGVIVKLNSPFYNTHERYFGVGVGGDGTLTANGVYFTSATDDELGGDSNGDGYSTGTPGYWSSIYFGTSAGGSVLNGCFIRYGGAQSNNSADAAIYIVGSSPTITGCEFFSNLTNIRAAGGNPTITNNSIMSTGELGYGMWLDIAVVNHNVSGNTFSNGSYYQARLDPMAVEQFVLRDTIGLNPSGKYNAIYVEEGIVSQSTTWPTLPQDLVYYVAGSDYTVLVQGAGNPVLTIESGVIVKFNSPYYNTHERYFLIGNTAAGRLSATGVYFTAATDDELGGDSNGDDYSTGVPGYWSSIYFGPNAGGSVLDGCFIRYGGNTSNNGADAAVYITGSNPILTGCEFRNNRTAVRMSNAQPSIIGCTFDTNYIGILATGSYPHITDNDFTNSTSFAVRNTTTTYNIDASNNWWGHSSGPLDTSSLVGENGNTCDPNPLGLGDQVSDYVLYCPWTVEDTTINVTPASLIFATTETTGAPDPQTIHIDTDWPEGTLNWELFKEADWLHVDKITGSNPDSVIVSIADTNYPAGIYSTYLWLVDTNASNSPKYVHITLFVESRGVDISDQEVEPGNIVGVPINLLTDQPLNGFTIPLWFCNSQESSVILDSVVVDHDLVDSVIIDDRIIIVYRVIQEPPMPDSNLEAGAYTLGHIYYTILPDAVDDRIIIDTSAVTYDGTLYEFEFSYVSGETEVPPFSAGTITIGHPEGCCIGIRGNVDGDYCDEIDISDIVYLIDYMFGGDPEPECFEEADIYPDGQIDISDLVWLINYMFQGGLPPYSCGESVEPLVAAKSGGEVVVDLDYVDGYTIVSLQTPIDLGGVQLELIGEGTTDPVNLLGEEFELAWGRKGTTVNAGLFDMRGDHDIKAGISRLIKLEGNYELHEACAASVSGEPVAVNRGAVGDDNMPYSFALYQNYPNPFNPSTTIKFSLPEAGHVNLTIFNVLGQTVTTLVDQFYPAGEYDAMWDSHNDQGQSVSSGVYFYRLDAAHQHETKKMMLLK